MTRKIKFKQICFIYLNNISPELIFFPGEALLGPLIHPGDGGAGRVENKQQFP